LEARVEVDEQLWRGIAEALAAAFPEPKPGLALDSGRLIVRLELLDPGAVRRLLEDPVSASRLGEAARHTAASRFTLDRMVEETLALYDSLLSRAGAPAPRSGPQALP
jgi:hypothetical protein